MDPDILLTAGVVLAVLSVPSMLSAFSERRAPRLAALIAIAAGGLIYWAVADNPSEFTLQDIPDAFIRVAAKVL